MADEQRVRTMAGWIGVEISRSRVRTPGKAGYGLYRVRGSVGFRNTLNPTPGNEHGYEVGKWTAYAFTLAEIERAAEQAITGGRGGAPGAFVIESAATDVRLVGIPTRWTQAYQGRRDLGVAEFRDRPAAMCHRCPLDVEGVQCSGTVRIPAGEQAGTCTSCGQRSTRQFEPYSIPVALKPEYVAKLEALTALLGAGLVEMVHVEGCSCQDPPARMSAACVRATMPDRMRQRADDREFQAEHQRARDYGLVQRYGHKRARLRMSGNPAGGNGPESLSEGRTDGP